MLGTVNCRLGLMNEAQQCLQRALTLEPANLENRFLLAKVLEYQGSYKDAGLHYEEVLSQWPDFAEAHCHLGNTLLARGLLAGAIEKYKHAIDLEPALAEAHANLGGALLRQGYVNDAEASLRKAVSFNPDLAEAYHFLGDMYKEQGNAHAAVENYRKALQLKPELAETLNNMGSILADQYHLEEAAECFRKALRIKPTLAEAHVNLAIVFLEQGKFDDAIQSCTEAMRIDPNYVNAYNSIGRIYKVQAEMEKALSSYKKALEIAPGNPKATAGLADLYERLGQKDEAAAVVQTLIEAESELCDAALVFGRLAKHTGRYGEAVSIIERLLQSQIPTMVQRGSLHFALGNLLDSMGEFDSAFEQFQKGNELKARAHRFDMAQYTRYINEVINVFNAEDMQRAPRAAHGSQRPLFIVGMPRSGTTLVEQIMDKHRDVYGAGELSAVSSIAASLADPAGSEYIRDLTQITQDRCDRLAGQYLKLLDKFSPTVKFVTDKMPSNFMHLGLISLLFPGARIIHCVRDPLDACLSCYFQDFAGGMCSFAHDLANLGEYYNQYRRLMRHWKGVLDLPMLEIHYEDIVSDQELMTRRLLDFCGLDWDPECLRFQDNRRIVTTASYDQVRQPLYTRSIGRWKHYERHLGPLTDGLRQLADEA